MRRPIDRRRDHCLGRCRTGPRPRLAAGIAAGLLPLLLVLATAAGPSAAQQAPETTVFESGELRYAVALPTGCRHEEGPGTVDAICATDFDAERSAVASHAGALVLGVAAEALVPEGDITADGLRQRHGEASFREELPEAVCGESDKGRVKIEGFKEVVEEGRLVYTASVVCAPVRFLQIGERRAAVRQVMAPDMRYRLVARALTEDFEKQRATVDAFFTSFRALPAVGPPIAGK
jgi:hypothetical protein